VQLTSSCDEPQEARSTAAVRRWVPSVSPACLWHLTGKHFESCFRANRNVLLDRGQERPALAEAIGATCFPTAGADATPIPRTTVTALPADGTADMKGISVRWKARIRSCKRLLHELVIACRIGSRQGVRKRAARTHGFEQLPGPATAGPPPSDGGSLGGIGRSRPRQFCM
jgi:hypothetical protein